MESGKYDSIFSLLMFNSLRNSTISSAKEYALLCKSFFSIAFYSLFFLTSSLFQNMNSDLEFLAC